MRRVAVVLAGVLTVLWIAAPASAFAHDRVANPYAHAALDIAVLAVVTAPIWTAYLWGAGRRGLLVTLIGIVQLPAVVVAFVPIAHPGLHVAALVGALALTGASLAYVRHHAPAPDTASESV